MTPKNPIHRETSRIHRPFIMRKSPYHHFTTPFAAPKRPIRSATALLQLWRPYPSPIHHAKEPISSLYNPIGCSKKAYSFRNRAPFITLKTGKSRVHRSQEHHMLLKRVLVNKASFGVQTSPAHHSAPC